MRRLQDQTGHAVQFVLVYVREAHAAEEWTMPDNEARGLVVPQPKTLDERAHAARECVGDYVLSMPTVVDTIDDSVSNVYGGWPDRMYVIDADGRIVYQGGVGPFGFKPDEVREFLREEFDI